MPDTTPTITKMPFGQTGHTSTRVIFGAAALGAMNQERADGVLETLLETKLSFITLSSTQALIITFLPRHRLHRAIETAET